MGERCQWLRDPEFGRWFLPGCMGGAVYGESQCTCRPVRRKLEAAGDTLEDRLERMEAKIDILLRTQPDVGEPKLTRDA